MSRPRGAKPSPKHRAFAVQPHVAQAVPPHFGVVPPTLSYWGNDVHGDCVSAEEAAAKAVYSVQLGQPEIVIPDNVLIAWAATNGYLDGAVITDVMDTMIRVGITSNGAIYQDGPYQSVDWTNDAVLSSAIYTGPVKIGVAADQLENVVRSSNGWWGIGFTSDQNEDHCVALCGFGTAQDLAAMLGVSVPVSLSPATRCYLLFTWSTIGIITRDSLIAITGEAWLRNPTTPGTVPVPTPTPEPTPPPTPTPVPPTPTPVPPVPTPPPTPVPTPPPQPVPSSVGTWDATTRTVKVPFGWHSQHGMMPSVIIHPHLGIVEVPRGWTVQH